MSFKLLCINGPNLNMLGEREPEIYGSSTLRDIENLLRKKADKVKAQIEFFQSNHEGELVNKIQQSKNEKVDFLLLNLAAFTHSSIAILDALRFTGIPYIELHLSNIYARESIRHISLFSKDAIGVICGFKKHSYVLAFDGAINYLNNQ